MTSELVSIVCEGIADCEKLDYVHEQKRELATAVLYIWLKRWAKAHDDILKMVLERENVTDVTTNGQCWACSGESVWYDCYCKQRRIKIAVIEYEADLGWLSDIFYQQENCGYCKKYGERKFVIEFPKSDGDFSDFELNPVRDWAWNYSCVGETPRPMSIRIGTIDEIRKELGIVETIQFPDGRIETERDSATDDEFEKKLNE